ncbi:hypothetical protein C6499_11690 [Candidatus Poribacteria bacterium]|nr:MAG: hypothetical protein C6499_11690 [Candidatus Poribacteria bacterium]
MRQLILILALTYSIVGILSQVSVAEIDPETAVGVWLFDEGGGNETKDASGNNHDGTINGAKWKDGKFGKALEFDGGQWVTIESTPELQVGEELTMMAWFFATDIGDWRQLIAKSNEYLLRIDPPGEGNKMSAFVKPGGSWEPRASAHVPDEKKWIHFAATYDSNAKNEQLVVYVNGKRAGVSTRPGDIAVTGNAVEIGRWGGGSYFVGIIDEAAIFNTVLSEDDLTTIAEHGLAKALGGLAVAPTNKLATTWATLKADR